MDGKKLYPSKYVKYLGVLIDSHFTVSYHMNSISTKLSRAIGLLSKIRQVYMLRKILYVQYISVFFPQYLRMHHKFGGKLKVDILYDWLPFKIKL